VNFKPRMLSGGRTRNAVGGGSALFREWFLALGFGILPGVPCELRVQQHHPLVQ
jgi:hypothetical protein